MKSFLRAWIERPRLALGLIALSCFACLWLSRDIRMRFQYRDFYDYPGNPGVQTLREYNRDFGDYQHVVVLLEAADVFSVDTLRFIDEVTRDLERNPLFSHVLSLSNAATIRAAGDDVQTGPVMVELPRTDADAKRIGKYALDSALLKRRVVAVDGTATAIAAELRESAYFTTIEQQSAAIDATRKVLDAHPTPKGVTVRLTGAPTVEVATTHALISDQTVLIPASLSVIMLALFLTFRCAQGIILPMLAVLVSMVWTAGCFAQLGRPIDIIGSTIPTTLLVYGVVDPIFVMTRYYGKLETGQTRVEAIVAAYSELLTPCMLTSFTTAVGFAAFITAELPTIRYYGATVALGVLFALLTTILVLPPLLVLTNPPKQRQTGLRVSAGVDTMLRGLWRVVNRRRAHVIVAAFVSLAVGFWAYQRLIVSNEYVGSLPKGEALSSVRALEDKLTGVVGLAVYVRGAPNAIKRPEVLRAIEEIDHAAEHLPRVNISLSLADALAEANQAFQGGDVQDRRVPTSSALIGQYLTMIDPVDRARLVNDNFSHTQILLMLDDPGSREFRKIADQLDKLCAQKLKPLGLQVSLTGAVEPLRVLDKAVDEVLWGFVFAILAIVLLELIVLRSWRAAVLSVLPNLVPVAGCFVTMWLIGANLRIDSVLTLCVSIGGLFNTTIHITARIMQQLAQGQSDPDAIVEQSLRTVGPPSLYTAVILSLGFAVMTCSRFRGLQLLGLLSLVTLLLGFVSDAAVTTALMRSFFRFRPRSSGGAS
jgi:predicted RND superfamily exporter protein